MRYWELLSFRETGQEKNVLNDRNLGPPLLTVWPWALLLSELHILKFLLPLLLPPPSPPLPPSSSLKSATRNSFLLDLLAKHCCACFAFIYSLNSHKNFRMHLNISRLIFSMSTLMIHDKSKSQSCSVICPWSWN